MFGDYTFGGTEGYDSFLPDISLSDSISQTEFVDRNFFFVATPTETFSTEESIESVATLGGASIIEPATPDEDISIYIIGTTTLSDIVSASEFIAIDWIRYGPGKVPDGKTIRLGV